MKNTLKRGSTEARQASMRPFQNPIYPSLVSYPYPRIRARCKKRRHNESRERVRTLSLSCDCRSCTMARASSLCVCTIDGRTQQARAIRINRHPSYIGFRVVHPGDELSKNNRNPGDILGKFCNPGRFCTSMMHKVLVSERYESRPPSVTSQHLLLFDFLSVV